MVRKKGKGKQITSKQIFITLLLVLIVAFGAIFLFSGTGENVAGQAGYSGPTKNVYIKNTLSGEYLCGGVKYVPSSNNFLYELNTCKTIDAEGTKWDILTLGSLSRIQVATVAKNVLCTGSKFSFSAKVCNGVIPGYAVTTTINEVDGVSSVQFSENKGYLCSSDNGEIANCNALHKSVTYNGYNGNWGTYWIIGDKNFVTKSSVDSCSPEGVSKDDNKKLCYNKGWVTCGKDWISPEKYDGKYLCPGKVQEVWLECNPENNGVTNKHNQRYCDGTKWLSCTKELDGTYKGDRQCVSGFWVTDASIGDDKLFEVTIDKTKRKINGLNYDLCDLNTASLSDRATICRENVQVIPTVYSLQALKLKADLKPVIYDIGDSTKVLLKYIEPADQNKIVSMVLHKNIGSVLVNTNDKKENQIPQITIYKATFSLGTFSSNLAAGQRLALQLIGQPEIYLLSHPKDELFSFDKLQMEELKGSSTITKETKGNFYQFKFPGGFITVEDKGTSVEISSLKAGEAAVSSAKINILNEVYEIPFDFGNPVKLKDFGEDVISVCTNDQAKDPTALRVCLNNNPIEGELINEGILTKIKISEGKELAMLYRYENDKKTGYLFHLIDINEKGTLVDYNFFPEAMATGRRLALEFSGHLYLLAHPVKNVIAMSEASIQTFTKDKNPEDKLIGDNFRAEALVADGKIIVERDATKTQLPYTLKGLTKSQLAEVDIDLSQEFHTQMSSKIPVKITNENLGIVAVDPANDIAKDFNTFKIIAAGTQKIYLLKDKMPVVEGKVLFYYVAQGDIKKADLYYLHNLDEKLLYKQDYDDAFIKTFTAGKKIALLYKGQYYLLGFKGTSNAFVISDVTLETIGGSPIVGTAVGSKIDFAVPDSILSVWIQNNKEGKDTIFFTAEDLSTKTFQEEQY
ncbi:hypothetical protein HQ489_03965, partial [Candidatus Woesearchaeota archaeon]|nr:hypothetical protein [Candidatus Woesearchaeota archaeon]